MSNFLVGAAAVVAAFLILIGSHELGHFALAKLFRMRVIEFAIGAGPRLWSMTRGGTLYALRPLPVLGYVRIGGMEPGDFDDPQGFHAKPAYQRLLVLAAGPMANFLMAALIVIGIGLSQVNSDPGRIADVTKQSAAARSGLKSGDSIVGLNGDRFHGAEDLRRFERSHPGAPVNLVVRHLDGRMDSLTLQPDPQTMIIGVEIALVRTPGQAVGDGVAFPFRVIGETVTGLYQLVTGQIPGGVAGPNGIHGAVGIGDITAQAALIGIDDWLLVVALLSVGVGFANLFPIPVLDGGRMLIVLLEKLRGQPFDRQREMVLQRITMVAILVLVAWIALLDTQRILTHQFPLLK